ncbi:MAG: type II toxin-antitoxin system RelE/ParE family toxin [Gammaproteobacteria bacterium]
MIKSFRHRGLKALYTGKSTKLLAPDHLDKLLDVLTVLDRSRIPEDMNLPGFRLHSLKGKLKGYWAVSISGNWRVIFQFDEGHAINVDYIDYH